MDSADLSQSPERSNRVATMSALVLLPVLACFLGGATQKWTEGIVVAFLGICLLIRPPRFSLGWVTNLVLLAIIGCAAIAFLPASWFWMPSWRTAGVQDLNISIPQTVSPQPWLTAGAFVSLIAGICWFYRVATIDLDIRGTRFALRLFATGIVALAALSILFYIGHLTPALWTNERGFGPFPNRNQTADLFGISAIVVLACAQDDFRSGRIRWIVDVAAMGILLAAVILNYSRAGIAIFVGGSFLWIIAVALRQRSTPAIAVGVSFLLVLLSAVLVLGGKTLERFQQWGSSGPGISSDLRWKIFHDTFELIRNSPWCGIGLANFHSVFAFFRKESIGGLTVLHPESDWLWLGSEAGWVAVGLVVIAGILILRRVFPLQEGTNQRFRLATLIAAFIFAAHGLVDVSAHRVGTAYVGLFLFGLVLHRPLRLKQSRSITVFFRLMGIFFVGIGVSWIIPVLTGKLIPGGAGVTEAKKLAAAAYQARNFPETIRLTSRAIDWAPLDWDLYFRRALAEVASQRPAEALTDFRRARFLEPVAYELPRDEGLAWLATQPTLAATAWRDALRKAGRSRSELFATMLTAATMHNAQVRDTLEEIGLGEPDLALTYLGRLKGPEFRDGLSKLLARNPNLESLSETQRLALFDLWSERGDLDELARVVQAHPQWLRFAWLGMAKYNANKGDFAAACDLTQRFGEPVAMPRISVNGTLPELQNRFASNPDNLTTGYSLYQAQMEAKRFDDALNTARHFSERPSSPAYFHVLEAKAWTAKQNWERAWQAWLAYREAASKK